MLFFILVVSVLSWALLCLNCLVLSFILAQQVLMITVVYCIHLLLSVLDMEHLWYPDPCWIVLVLILQFICLDLWLVFCFLWYILYYGYNMQ